MAEWTHSESPIPSSLSSRSMTPIDRSTTIVRASNSGLMDDDSMLGKDYVVVEKRTVEINALADGSSRPLL